MNENPDIFGGGVDDLSNALIAAQLCVKAGLIALGAETIEAVTVEVAGLAMPDLDPRAGTFVMPINAALRLAHDLVAVIQGLREATSAPDTIPDDVLASVANDLNNPNNTEES